MEKINFGQSKQLESIKNIEKQELFWPKEEILQLSPDKLIHYLTDLQKNGDLDKFLEFAVNDASLLAHLSYWEKWLEKDQRRLLENLVQKKKELYPDRSESLPLELEKNFPPEELKLIFSNIKAIQLTYGCSRGCTFCGFDAIKGVREYISYSQLANLFQEYGSAISEARPILYWASEPSDYLSEDRTYEDVHELALNYAGYDPSITTVNQDQSWLNFMALSKDLKKINEWNFLSKSSNRRLSSTTLNEYQKNKAEEKIINAAKEALKYSRDNRSFENIKDVPYLKGMGKSFEKRDEASGILLSGIASYDGMLLTPRGLFNIFVIPISQEYPQGTVVVPFEKLEDKKISVNDNLKEIMRWGIIKGKYSYSGRINTNNSGQTEDFQRYVGKFPKELVLYTKSKSYNIEVDSAGKILKAEELANIPNFNQIYYEDSKFKTSKIHIIQMKSRLINQLFETVGVNCSGDEHLEGLLKEVINKFNIYLKNTYALNDLFNHYSTGEIDENKYIEEFSQIEKNNFSLSDDIINFLDIISKKISEKGEDDSDIRKLMFLVVEHLLN